MTLAMRTDIEGDWMIFSTCNYRCDYCFLSERDLGAKVNVVASPQQWRAAFDRTELTWLLHITGGEPTHYPDFVELTETLTQRHTLSLNSNLTGPAILGFAERVDPARVSFINAGLHPAERNRRNGHAVFLRHAEALLKRGFPLMATVVATPEVLRTFDAITRSLKPVGLTPFPKMMQGAKTGALYPDSYTAEERALFLQHSLAAEKANPRLFGRTVLGGRIERPSIDPTMGRRHLAKTPSYLGRMCTAGRDFVTITPTGDIWRCGGGSTMGNLLDGSIKLRKKAKPCDREHCFYFCEKFTARAAAEQKPLAVFARKVKRAFALAAR